jgi:hypothetical protein
MAETVANLSILPPEQHKSVEHCLAVGQRSVNWPVFAIMLFCYALPFALFKLDLYPHHLDLGSTFTPIIGSAIGVSAILYIIFGPPLIAWIWWSAKISKWRIWALRTVDDWPSLERRAIEGRLIWPRGSIFEKTELKSAEQRALEAALLHARDKEGRFSNLPSP